MIETEGKIMQWSDEDKFEAGQIREQLEDTLSAVKVHEVALESGYVELGKVLLRVRQKRYWVIYGHKSWTEYIESMHDKIGRFQLFRYIGVVETLGSQFSDAELSQIGISKAATIRGLMLAKPDSPLPEKVREAALDPKSTTEDLRKVVFEETNVDQGHPGTFRDLEGFYATDEEWALIQRAFNVAKRTDPPIPNDLPKWAQLKEILTRMAADFLASFEAEVEGR